MARSVEVVLPVSEIDDFLNQAQEIEGVVGVQLREGSSWKPDGGVVKITTTDRGLLRVMHLLDEYKLGKREGTSVTISDASAIISPAAWEPLGSDPNEGTLEEMETICGKESNMTRDTLLLMAVSGFIAAFGIATGSLHLVIGSMVIAPGFLPLARIGLGVAAGGGSLWRGLRDTLKGYLALVAGALIAALLILLISGDPLLADSTSYMASEQLVRYWSSISAPSLFVSAAAAVGGAVLIGSKRTVLTGGVMIALALVPAATLAVLAISGGKLQLAGFAFLRWLIDAVLVAGLSVIVFGWKSRFVHKRRMMLS